jgi:hypothetical protein
MQRGLALRETAAALTLPTVLAGGESVEYRVRIGLLSDAVS